MNHANAIELRIAKLLTEEMALDVPSAETDLIEAGYIDSLLLAELLTHLEREFSFRVRIDELDLEELRSIAGVARFVEKQLGHGACADKGVRDGDGATAG
jgi:acyl carrier protein